LKIYISQGSVATQLRCDDIFSKHFSQFFHRMHRCKILKIGQYLATIWTNVWGLPVLFWPTLYVL